MVGFLGTQTLLSASGLGSNAEEHSTITLKNGTVITGYYTSNSGPMSLYSFNPKTGETKSIGGFGDFTTDYGDPHLVASDDGGFRVVYNLKALDGGLFYRKYDALGAQQGDVKQLLDGWIDNAQTYETDKGFFVSYRDRSADADTEYVGAFYGNTGKLQNTFDFKAGANPSGFAHPEPQATLLSNGNLAVVWQKTNLDGSFLQVFKPNGAKVGGEKALGNIPLTIHPKVIEAHPDGGFVVAHAPIISPPGGISQLGTIVIQKYTNSGKKLGREITFDTAAEDFGRLVSGSNYDVAFTKDGLIAVTWTGEGTTLANGTDVYFAMLTASGKVIVGPQAADETLNSDQLDVQFNHLKNGDLYLTFKDDATVQFSHVASIQGRFIVEPDYIYEGDGKNNNEAGTGGDDVLLGFGGDDILKGLKGEDYIKGGRGNDALSGDEKGDELYGEEGADNLSGGKGDDLLYGGTGNDIILGGAGTDQIFGGDGDDTIKGGTGADTIYGGNGKDKITGGTAASTLHGEAGRDRLVGGDGSDALWGGDDNDVLIGNIGNDVLDGGLGRDKLIGGTGFDILRGGEGNDKLFGGDDNDAFYAGDGNDRAFGDDGDDTFYDSEGDDQMTGGAGADKFLFYNTDFGHDVIKDFEFGVDTLDMGVVARALDTTGGDISINEVTAGVRFKVDADNWVLVKGATLADFEEGDYIIEDPFAVV
ncbi:MAG: hypothetical protein KUG74_14515 [Rhodobacteraceae bacterium]|nr:hypothetical protein [Paracoccaceae bacterium]